MSAHIIELERIVGRIRNNNYDSSGSDNDSNFLIAQREFYIRKSIGGVKTIIKKCIQSYQETKDSDALKLAFDCYISLDELTREAEKLHSYGHDFELTK